MTDRNLPAGSSFRLIDGDVGEPDAAGPDADSLLAPYVGGHPEMPLHPFEDAGDGTCLACTRAEDA